MELLVGSDDDSLTVYHLGGCVDLFNVVRFLEVIRILNECEIIR